MKGGSGIKVLIVKVSQNDPVYPSTPKNFQVDSMIEDMGKSYMFKKKFINQPKLLEREWLGTKNDALDPSSQKF